MINILVLKISMHTTGSGGMIAMMLILTPYTEYNALWFIVAAILIAGCVGAARLALKAHSEREVYYGYLSGFFSFMVAANIFHM
jgi:membrane-associated phospholipid phosphatase